MESRTQGAERYPGSTLLASSSGLGWSTLSAELRRHVPGETPAIAPQQAEICLVVVGNERGFVRRTGSGDLQQAVADSGAIWLSPMGASNDVLTITAPIPQTLHLYLPTATFARLDDDLDSAASPIHSIRHVVGVRDEVIQHLGCSILAELTNETRAGRMYVETVSLTLAARLLQKYCDFAAHLEVAPENLDRVRLRRVLDYIAAHLDDEMSLAGLAAVARYSPYHFARKFAATMGVPPHRYISGVRLQRAMRELAAGKLSLAEIALNAKYSSQASFTRAFHRATGKTPKEYRSQERSFFATPS